jgi:hypothetical protein
MDDAEKEVKAWGIAPRASCNAWAEDFERAARARNTT